MPAKSLYVAKPNKLKPAPSGTPSISKDGALEVRMFNVGSGEAILLIFPPSRVWLVDGGTTNGKIKNEILGKELAKYLKSRDLILESLVASHPHVDHVGAVSYLLKKKPKLASKLSYFYTKELGGKEKDWLQDLENELKLLGNKVEWNDMKNKHREIEISNQVSVHLFAGSGEGAYTSVFMHVHYKEAKLFFAGDVHCTYENKLLDRYGKADFRADLLKITHHGSSTGTGNKFVDAVKPALAIASTSIDGGHRLEKDVIKRLPRFCKKLQTLIDGDITIRTAGRSIQGGVLYESKTSSNGSALPTGLFAHALDVPSISDQKALPDQKSAPECLAEP